MNERHKRLYHAYSDFMNLVYEANNVDENDGAILNRAWHIIGDIVSVADSDQVSFREEMLGVYDSLNDAQIAYDKYLERLDDAYVVFKRLAERYKVG